MPTRPCGSSLTDRATPLHAQEFQTSFAVARRVASFMLGETDAAIDDVASCAMQRMLRWRGAAIANPRAFIAAVTRNLARDELRRRRGRARTDRPRTADTLLQEALRVPLSDALPDPAGDPESQLIGRQDRAWLLAAVADLTVRQREALLTPTGGEHAPATPALRQARRSAVRRLRDLARHAGWNVPPVPLSMAGRDSQGTSIRV